MSSSCVSVPRAAKISHTYAYIYMCTYKISSSKKKNPNRADLHYELPKSDLYMLHLNVAPHHPGRRTVL